MRPLRGLGADLLELLADAPFPLTVGQMQTIIEPRLELSELSASLVKLEQRGLVSSELADRTAETGRRKVKRYTATEAGKRITALRYIKGGGMRSTGRKRAILDLLEQHDEWHYAQYGTPPYSATDIAEVAGGSRSSVARTLRGMAIAGDLVAVRCKQDIWNAIAGSHIEMTVTAYYSARTMERDKAIAEAWQAGSKARQEAALARMFGATPAMPGKAAVDG